VIAVSHPGKIGDALWALPATKYLCDVNNCKADFYTSNYCLAMKELVEAQPYINKMIVPPEYVVLRTDIGCQPWLMPIPAGYSNIYHLGFKSVPNKCIGAFIAEQVGLSPTIGYKVAYSCDVSLPKEIDGKDYISLAPRGVTSFLDLFKSFCDVCPLLVVEVGAKGEYIGKGFDATGLNMLEMAAIISKSKGFVGLMSAPLVVANGFPIHKVIVHNGINWDMRHVMYSDIHHYLVNPQPSEMITALGLK